MNALTGCAPTGAFPALPRKAAPNCVVSGSIRATLHGR